MKTLFDLYKAHTGKVSDKWALYLREYDRLFAPYREQPISMLEIGVQNGGSLEIWSQYFPNAQKFVGCDINPDCAKLTYADTRIAVVVGDATTPETQAKVQEESANFDLIIDDGSHTSGDIVKAFARYFPMLKSGGLFVAEDLHCSYWQDYEGGIFHPYSSITFFKHLSDMVNHEHWGVEKSRKDLIAGYKQAHNVDFDESLLSQILSVEFINSICVLRKSDIDTNSLGGRVIAGDMEFVAGGHFSLTGTKLVSPIQTFNEWSNLDKPPAENYKNFVNEINIVNERIKHEIAASRQLSEEKQAKERELGRLNCEMQDKNLQIEKLRKEKQANETELGRLNCEMQDKNLEIEKLREEKQANETELGRLLHEVNVLRNSRSWRITAPLRAIGGMLRRLNSPAVQQVSNCYARATMSSMDAIDGHNGQSASFEVLSGLAQQPKTLELKKDVSTLIAFYLPQYHKVAENSEWWGPGFTEWTNVVKGKPNYSGHYQPHLPRELGFYDLSNVEVMREQAEMAKLYGIGAFCFYYYWFSGRRILEKPIDNYLHSDIEMPYCLCWANENWTRTWDGDNRSVLLEQKYLESDPQAFIDQVLPHFRDVRYLKVDGKPMLVVYRAKDIPNVARVFQLWRDAVKSAGFADLHIAAVDFYDIARPDEVGADALVEFPPHKFNGSNTVPDHVPTISNDEFNGSIVDYAKVMAQSANRSVPDFTLYRGVIPSWDNTARRQNTPTIIHGSNPDLFKDWLSYIRTYTREVLSGRSDNFIFVNAWNEWGEGCHLEPDQKYGLQYLEAVNTSSYYEESFDDLDKARNTLIAKAADSIRMRDLPDKQSSSPVLIEQALHANTATLGLAQSIAFQLRNYPITFFVAKKIYKTYCFIWKR